MSAAFNLLTWLGLTLLYMPPFLAFTGRPILDRVMPRLSFKWGLWISLLLTGLMIYLMPEASLAFFIYLAAFNFFYFYAGRLFGKSLGLRLAIYVCFAVSVLWEWPIQLVIPQNMDAVIMSGLKALAIPLFFYEAYRLGFRGSDSFNLRLFLAAIMGIVLTLALYISPAILSNSVTYAGYHLYRALWFLMFLAAINATAKRIYTENEFHSKLSLEVV